MFGLYFALLLNMFRMLRRVQEPLMAVIKEEFPLALGSP